ncbi:flippase [Knoellia sp. p5-6-4]|uniref:flippase n=1 Tax=unclassified Knoellia TaxID=2618719 RepID=UPI0023DB7C6C|nr:flippase [Knoellia sp. p5-6-4]MDF2146902.1 flippase [Knoellia sp. p5-6-4]
MSSSTASRDINRMGRGGGLNLVGAVWNQVALFGIISLLAAQLGEDDVGRYASCYALLSLLGLLSLAGFRSAMTRFVAMHVADGDASRLRGTLRMGLGLTVLASLVIGGLLAALAPWVARTLSGPAMTDDPAMAAGVRLVALSLPAVTFSDAALAATQGWRTQRPFTLIGRIFEPGLKFALTAGALAAGLAFEGAMWSIVAAAWAAAALAGLALKAQLRGTPGADAVYEIREIFSFSMVSWLAALAATGLIWVGTLLLGAMEGQAEVGSFNVATRLVMLAVFVMAPINAAFTPHMAHLFHTGQVEESARAYGSATRWILTLSMPAFIVLIAFPTQLLGYFGEVYTTAAAVTVILAFGQLVSAAAGPCGTVLNMSGRVRLSMLDNIGALALGVVLNLVLIPSYGIVGAAVAWSASLVAANSAKVVQARYVVGVPAAGARLGRILLAAVPAAGTAALLTQWVHHWTGVVLIAAPLVAVVFFGVLVALGVQPEDRALVASLARRRARVTRAGAA